MAAKKENEIAVSIPFEQIDKIEIYLNKYPNRKSLASIMTTTGADYAINGTLYNMKTGKAVCPLKKDGTVLCGSKYKYRGYSWENVDVETFALDVVPTEDWSNYIACSNIVKDGVALAKPIYNAAQGSYRARSAIGTKTVNGKRRICLYACTEAKGIRKTPEQLAKLLQEYGWDDAIMLDCGGSSQAYFRKEKRQVFSSRQVAHYILVYLKKEYR